VKQADGSEQQVPGKLKSVKGIGWFIEEYGIAQLSLNLTDITVTPVHIAFDEACKSAAGAWHPGHRQRTGGPDPETVLAGCGRLLPGSAKSAAWAFSEREKIKIAVKSLGLDDLGPFDPQKKVIEYMLEEPEGRTLVRMDLKRFSEETAAKALPPVAAGGRLRGCARRGARNHGGQPQRAQTRLGRPLGGYSNWAVIGEKLPQRLLLLVDEDTRAFDRIMTAMGLPKGSDAEKVARKAAISKPPRVPSSPRCAPCRCAWRAWP
jgi:glutamate formiminotransferase/formiminotetrahydrofolate cyclodeaminase